MAKPGGLMHMFAELSSLDELSQLLRRSARLKYTCLSVSRKYLALGSNTGGVYIFSRDTLKYLQVVFGDTEYSPVIKVSLSPSDQFVSFASSTGHVFVIELNIDRRVKPERIRNTSDHAGNTVTALTWEATSSKLFIGDSTGKLSIIHVPTAKSKALFTVPSEVIAYVDMPVYQMEWWKDKLVVSTTTHTHLFDTIKHNYSTIGTKSRDGEFGACFFVEPSSQCTVIYCSRPGSRMWEVDFEGKVLNTHQFKQLLSVTPIPVLSVTKETFEFTSNNIQTAQSVNFLKMLRVGQFIVTWSLKGLYVFDPINVKVIVWTQSFKGITDLMVYNNDIYIFLESAAIHKLTLLPVYQIFTILCNRSHWLLMSSLLLAADQMSMRPAIVKKVKQDLLQALLSGLKEAGKLAMVEKVKATMEDVSEGSVDSLGVTDDFMDPAEVMGHTYLPSGMVVVNDGAQIKRTTEKSDPGMKAADKTDIPLKTLAVESMYRNNDITDDKNEGLIIDKANDENIGQDASGEVREGNNQSETTQYKQDIGLDVDGTSLYEDEHQHLVLVSENATNLLSENLEEAVQSDISQTVCVESTVSRAEPLSDTGEQTSKDVTGQVNASFSDQSGKVNILDANDNVKTSADEKSPHIMTRDPSEEIKKGETSNSDHPEQFTFQQNCLQLGSEVLNDRSETNNSEVFSLDSSEENMVKLSIDSSNGHPGTSQDSVPPSDSEISVNDGIHQEKIVASLQLSQDLSKTSSVQDTEKTIHSALDSCNSLPVSAADDGGLSALSTVSSSKDGSYGTEPPAKSLQWSHTEPSSDCLQSSTLPTTPLRECESVLAVPMQDDAINARTDLSSSHKKLLDHQQPITKFSSVDTLSGIDSEIAQPLKVKKKRKKFDSQTRSTSLDTHSRRTRRGSLRSTGSVGDEYDDPSSVNKEPEIDTISIGTVSSIGEGDVIGSGGVTPDSESGIHDVVLRRYSTADVMSPELAVSPPDFSGKSNLRKTSTASYDDSNSEVIPPLIARLAAARGSRTSDDFIVGLRGDSISLGGSTENNVSHGSPRASLAALKDGLSMKLKTQTKSLIKTFKERNPLVTKSPSTPMLAGLSAQQLGGSLRETSSPQENDLEKLVMDDQDKQPAFDTTKLYLTALDIQQQLKNPEVIVRPATMRQILHEWAEQLCKTMLNYHEDLLMRTDNTNESDVRQKEGNGDIHLTKKMDKSSERPENKLNSELVGSPRNSTDLEEVINGAEVDSDTVLNGCESVQPKLDLSESSSVLPPSTNPPVKCLTPFYWVDVLHFRDPFQLPTKHMELFTHLTILCFAWGETGNILEHFQLTEEVHYQAFVAKLLPNCVLSRFDPVCYDRLMNLLPDSEHWSKRRIYSTIAGSSVGDYCTMCSQGQGAHVGTSSHTYLNQHNLHPSSLSNNVGNSSAGHGDSVSSKVDKDTGSVSHGNSRNSVGNATTVTLCHHCLSECTNKDFWQDLNFSLFLRIFFFVLDYEKVKQVTDGQGSKLFLTWASLLLCCKESGKGDIVSSILADKQVKSAIDYLRSGILPHRSALLGHVSALFGLSPLKTGEFCGEIHKDITIVDVVRLCALRGRSPSTCMLRYLKQVMVDLATVQRPAVFRQVCQHRDMRYLLLESLLPMHLSEASSDSNSQASSMMSVLPFDWLNILLDIIESDEERDEIVQLSSHIGHWQVCVKLLTQADKWQELLQLIVIANDLSLLKGKHGRDGYTPRTVEEWRYLLQVFHNKNSSVSVPSLHNEPGEDSVFFEEQNETQQPQETSDVVPSNDVRETSTSTENCKNIGEDVSKTITEHKVASQTTVGVQSSTQYESFTQGNGFDETSEDNDETSQDKTLTWSSLGYLLLQHVGGATAIDLLMEHLRNPSIAKKCLSSKFLHACFMDYNIKMAQNHVVHEMLEKISIYMWAKRPGFVPPSIHHALKSEKKLIEKGEGEEVAVQGVFGQVKSMETADLVSEYLGSHWGQEVNISSDCLCCHLPLKSVMSLSTQGVILFPCGHAFHKCCVASSMCPILH